MPVSLWIIVLAALALIALALFALFTRLERGLRDEIAEAGRAGRAESSANFAQFQQTVTAQLAQSNDRALAGMRATLERAFKDIEANTASKLDQIRHIVDEKLQATLEQR